MSSAPDQQQPDEQDVRIRRAPKYGRFMIVGGGLAAIITFVLTASFPVDPKVGFFALFGYFALFGVTAGVLLGALVALVLDRAGLKRARPATVVTELADPEDAERVEPIERVEPSERVEPVETAEGVSTSSTREDGSTRQDDEEPDEAR
jgi:hypothetical protein